MSFSVVLMGKTQSGRDFQAKSILEALISVNRVFAQVSPGRQNIGRRKIFSELILYANERVSIFMKQF